MEIADRNTEHDPTANLSVGLVTNEKEGNEKKQAPKVQRRKPGVKPIELGKYIKESEEKIATLRQEAQDEKLSKQ